MSKILSARIRENYKYEKPDGNEGVINSVEFRCSVRDTDDDVIGGCDVRRYTAQIDDLKHIFDGYDPATPVKDFVSKILGRECIFETKAVQFGDKVSERLVHVTFILQKGG